MLLPLPAVMEGFCSLSGVEPIDSSLSSRSGGFGGLVSMDILSAMPWVGPWRRQPRCGKRPSDSMKTKQRPVTSSGVGRRLDSTSGGKLSEGWPGGRQRWSLVRQWALRKTLLSASLGGGRMQLQGPWAQKVDQRDRRSAARLWRL
jgi:hypothetical protein